jgi:type IV secretory pathway TrbL component
LADDEKRVQAATDMVLLTYKVAQAESQLHEQNVHIEKLEDEFNQFRRALAQKERNNLAWGVGALGTVVATLAGVIWAYRSVIFR